MHFNFKNIYTTSNNFLSFSVFDEQRKLFNYVGSSKCSMKLILKKCCHLATKTTTARIKPSKIALKLFMPFLYVTGTNYDITIGI